LSPNPTEHDPEPSLSSCSSLSSNRSPSRCPYRSL
jgi:hypothetical protein